MCQPNRVRSRVGRPDDHFTTAVRAAVPKRSLHVSEKRGRELSPEACNAAHYPFLSRAAKPG